MQFLSFGWRNMLGSGQGGGGGGNGYILLTDFSSVGGQPVTITNLEVVPGVLDGDLIFNQHISGGAATLDNDEVAFLTTIGSAVPSLTSDTEIPREAGRVLYANYHSIDDFHLRCRLVLSTIPNNLASGSAAEASVYMVVGDMYASSEGLERLLLDDFAPNITNPTEVALVLDTVGAVYYYRLFGEADWKILATRSDGSTAILYAAIGVTGLTGRSVGVIEMKVPGVLYPSLVTPLTSDFSGFTNRVSSAVITDSRITGNGEDLAQIACENTTEADVLITMNGYNDAVSEGDSGIITRYEDISNFWKLGLWTVTTTPDTWNLTEMNVGVETQRGGNLLKDLAAPNKLTMRAIGNQYYVSVDGASILYVDGGNHLINETTHGVWLHRGDPGTEPYVEDYHRYKASGVTINV